MAIDLPPSLRRELHPIEEEVAYARSLTTEERLAAVALACRATMEVLNLNTQRDRVLAMRDPVPESTLRAFERLRRAARNGR